MHFKQCGKAFTKVILFIKVLRKENGIDLPSFVNIVLTSVYLVAFGILNESVISLISFGCIRGKKKN